MIKSMLPETRVKSYFTTARVITPTGEGEKQWLWVNSSLGWQFATEDEAQSHANLSNENGKDSGLDIEHAPYFVVRITQKSTIEKVA